MVEHIFRLAFFTERDYAHPPPPLVLPIRTSHHPAALEGSMARAGRARALEVLAGAEHLVNQQQVGRNDGRAVKQLALDRVLRVCCMSGRGKGKGRWVRFGSVRFGWVNVNRQ